MTVWLTIAIVLQDAPRPPVPCCWILILTFFYFVSVVIYWICNVKFILTGYVFNVYYSVWMHTADIEPHHATLWRSPQTFYTGGKLEKQVKRDLIKTNEEWSAQVGADFTLLALMLMKQLSLVPQFGSRVAYRKSYQPCLSFFLFPAVEKLLKISEGAVDLVHLLQIEKNKVDLGGFFCASTTSRWPVDNCTVVWWWHKNQMQRTESSNYQFWQVREEKSTNFDLRKVASCDQNTPCCMEMFPPPRCAN